MWLDGFDTCNLLQPNNMRHGFLGPTLSPHYPRRE